MKFLYIHNILELVFLEIVKHVRHLTVKLLTQMVNGANIKT